MPDKSIDLADEELRDAHRPSTLLSATGGQIVLHLRDCSFSAYGGIFLPFMGFLKGLFGRISRAPEPDKAVTLGMVKNKSGRFAVILRRGIGHHPGSFIQEINSDDTVSRRDPYWISARSTHWGYGGQADAIRTERNGNVLFRFTKIKRYHEHAEVFAQPVAWIVFLKSSNGTVEKHEIKACSSNDAKTALIERMPNNKGLLVSGCMLKAYYQQEWLS